MVLSPFRVAITDIPRKCTEKSDYIYVGAFLHTSAGASTHRSKFQNSGWLPVTLRYYWRSYGRYAQIPRSAMERVWLGDILSNYLQRTVHLNSLHFYFTSVYQFTTLKMFLTYNLSQPRDTHSTKVLVVVHAFRVKGQKQTDLIIHTEVSNFLQFRRLSSGLQKRKLFHSFSVKKQKIFLSRDTIPFWRYKT